ncbi:HET-domain-containing protein [Lentithecium fluviatile CBS 122367]|uniref:HET-domain-containing protein n=1 Tax=Lentithecium fluviatile CBS 122367 TaxID=1168545 RepID=A0A6G1IEW6_9PLEO|nr:HET-domain-containing protein [Lentithecium fluviatile CBS 122367]
MTDPVLESHSTICRRCSNLSFRELLLDPLRRAHLGPPASWMPDACDMCRFFLQSLPLEAQESDIELRSRSPISRVNRRLFRDVDDAGVCDDQGVFGLVERRSSRSYQWDLMPIEKLIPLVAVPAMIDFSLVQRWLEMCRSNGGDLLPSDEMLWLTVIDCKTRELVSLPAGEGYVALSYVWGSTSATTSETPETSRLPFRLPQSIEDAMTACRNIGIRYLWIDRYCISQANLEERLNQIRRMDTIYSNAFLTLVACAGQDPHDGLPGVSRARLTCPSIRLGDCGMYHMMAAENLIHRSTWDSRGWTYQEWLLSARRLYFTDRQLLFEAPEFCETEATCLSAAPRVPGDDYLYSLDHWAKEPYRCISIYTQRTLSVPSDILNAMLGIFAVFERRFQIQQLWGLPFTDGSRAWIEGVSEPPPTFTKSLLWTHDGVSRREGFPSWSWTGWYGQINWAHNTLRAKHSAEVDANDIKVELELTSGDLISWENYQQIYQWVNQGEGRLTIYIHIEAYVTPAVFRCLHDEDVPRGQLGLERKEGGYRLYGDSFGIPRSAGSTEPAMAPAGSLLGLHISPSRYDTNDRYTFEDVLIIKNTGGHWERIAILHLVTRDLLGLKMIRQKIRLG